MRRQNGAWHVTCTEHTENNRDIVGCEYSVGGWKVLLIASIEGELAVDGIDAIGLETIVSVAPVSQSACQHYVKGIYEDSHEGRMKGIIIDSIPFPCSVNKLLARDRYEGRHIHIRIHTDTHITGYNQTGKKGGKIRIQ